MSGVITPVNMHRTLIDLICGWMFWVDSLVLYLLFHLCSLIQICWPFVVSFIALNGNERGIAWSCSLNERKYGKPASINCNCFASSQGSTFKRLHNTICYTRSSWCWWHYDWKKKKFDLKGLSWVNVTATLSPFSHSTFNLRQAVSSKPHISKLVFIQL